MYCHEDHLQTAGRHSGSYPKFTSSFCTADLLAIKMHDYSEGNYKDTHTKCRVCFPQSSYQCDSSFYNVINADTDVN